ncbi:murein biosynthesis integral membrane protein MurJ [bacterium]|nr:MAG: murein biosynthesis integral membrane protein MurJ [bacterium]
MGEMSCQGRSEKESKGIIKAAGVVGSATFISRVLGLIRDAVMAYLFGATITADAFYVAFRIPNLMRQLFGEGALAASFVPVYTDIIDKDGTEKASGFADGLFTLLVAVLIVLSAAIVIFAPLVVRCVAWGFAPESEVFRQTVVLTRWLSPYVLLICVAALGMGILNAHRHFLAPALAPAMLNISIISSAILISPRLDNPIVGVAWGVLAGGALQVLIQWPPLRDRGVMPRFSRSVASPGVRRVAVMMGPAALGIAVYQVNMLVDTLLASFLPTGSITYLWYGNRMMQFPLGVFGIALATAALPTLSTQYSEGRTGDFTKTVSLSLRLTAFIGIPAALGLISLREPIIATLFGRGAFGVNDVSGAASALLYYSVGLPFFIAVKIIGRAFFAMEDTRIPFTAASAAMVANVFLNLLLMGPMLHSGLALATSLSSVLNFGILAVVFTRRVDSSWAGGGFTGEILKSLVSAIVMSAAVTWVSAKFVWLDLGLPSGVLGLIGCVLMGIIVYSTVALILGCDGMRTVRERLLDRKRR